MKSKQLPPTSVRLPKPEMNAVRSVAVAEKRSVSSMIRVLIAEALGARQQGARKSS